MTQRSEQPTQESLAAMRELMFPRQVWPMGYTEEMARRVEVGAALLDREKAKARAERDAEWERVTAEGFEKYPDAPLTRQVKQMVATAYERAAQVIDKEIADREKFEVHLSSLDELAEAIRGRAALEQAVSK